MRLKLTLQRPDSAEDVLVTLDAAATVGDLADALVRKDPEPGPAVSGDPTIRNHGASESGEPTVLDPKMPVVESGLRSGSRVSLASEPQASGAHASTRGQAAALLRVMSGSGAGREFPLYEGANYIGREAGNDVVLTDPLISKRHARVSVSSAIDIVDLDSANGVFLHGQQVQRATLTADDVVMLGDTAVAVLPLRKLTGAADSSVDFNRPPLVRPIFEGSVIDGPEPPERPQPFHLPFISMIAPLIMGVVLYLFTKSVMSIVFIGLSPLMIIGSMLDQARQNRHQVKDQLADFDVALGQLDEDLAKLQYVEVRSRLSESPSTAEAVDAAERLSSLLWMRRLDMPGFMTARLGLGTMMSRTQVALPQRKPTVPGAWERLVALTDKYRYVEDVPVVGDFKEAGGFGVAGPDDLSVGIARSLVLQLACLHSPAEVSITAVGGATSAQEWDWLKWLPHVNSGFSPVQGGSLANSGPSVLSLVSELEDVVAKRKAAQDKGSDVQGYPIEELPAVLVVVMDDAPVERSRLVQIAENGPEVAVFVLWVASTISRVPACCRAFVDVKADGDSMVGLVHTSESVVPVVCETADLMVAGHVARRLSPVVDSGARLEDDSDLPRSVSFLSAVGAEIADAPEPIIERWKAGDPTFLVAEPKPHRQTLSLRGAVGQAGGETFHLDLRTHGPHALVGGTTGAGKSEFLQSWVLGMAALHSPKRLTFLFVDYKGGSAFANCLQLPHCVGLVTDLSPYLVRRALASFRAELRYRERILEHKGAKDLIDLERSGDPDAPPSLLIIVDEFAALVQEVPEFIDGVVDVGQRGRSLGLHLVLATQQPSGVIKGSLRANTNLRVALRMADVDDSMDVIGDPMAGGFDPTIPGRGAAKTGPGRITHFQSLYAGGITPDEPPRPAVDIESLSFGPGQMWSLREGEKKSGDIEGDTDIARVVTQITRAAQQCEIAPPRKPWLDTLAATYELARLEQRRDNILVLGVEDDPDLQEHRQIAFRPDEEGNMSIFGTGGSGKSTVLRTLALSAAVTPRSGPCDVYGLDFGSRGLAMLEGMPHVGAIISGDDHERIARLFRWLRDLIEERSRRYAAVRAGTITEYRRAANAPDEPRILVLVDGMTNFRQEYEMGSRSSWFTVFGQICSDGRPVGVHVVMTGDRPNTVPSSLAATVQQRIILRLADDQDYAMVNAPADILTADSSPGRCIFNGLEAQIATLGGSQNLASQSRAVERLAETLRKMGRTPAKRIESLAERISLSELPAEIDGAPALGMRDDLLSPYGVKPAGTFLIIGPPASGRTTTLATIIRSTYRAYPRTRSYFFGNKRSQILGVAQWVEQALDEDSAMDLGMRLEEEIKSGRLAPTADSPVLIVMDNVSSYFNGMAEPTLQTMVSAADAHDIGVVAEAETSSITSSYALGTALRARRRGFALQPDDMDGTSVFRTTFPRMNRSEFPPGRGIVVDGGKMIRVQAALPD